MDKIHISKRLVDLVVWMRSRNMADQEQAVDQEQPVVEAMIEDESKVAEEPVPDGEKPTCLAEQLWFPFRVCVIKPKTSAIVVFSTNAVFIVVGLTLKFLSMLITRYGVFCLFLYGLYAAAGLLARSLAYPAHTKMVVRDMERECAKQMRNSMTHGIEAVSDYLAMLTSPESSPSRKWELNNLGGEVARIRQEVLEGFVNALHRMKQMMSNPDDFHGQVLLTALEELQVMMDKLDETVATFQNMDPSLFEATRLSLIDTGASSADAPSDGKMSLEPVRAAVAAAEEAIILMGGDKEKDKASWAIVKQFKQWWRAQSPMRLASGGLAIGGLDLMRADLSFRMNGEQVWVESKNGVRIDGMLIKGPPNAPKPSHPDKRTVLICNPNAGLYELHHFQSDWIMFYTRLGFDVFIYNYRGYARSTGTPSPQGNNADGEAVIAHLRATGVQLIAVHGESIGGLVANHLGANCNIDLLIADRTFANLNIIARHLIGAWADHGLRIATGWVTDNTSNFLSSPCAKIICCDPNDEIICDVGSVKTGVAMNVEFGKDAEKDLFNAVTLSTKPKGENGKGNPGRSRCPRKGEPLKPWDLITFYEALKSLAIRAEGATQAADAAGWNWQAGGLSSLDRGQVLRLWVLVARLDGLCGSLLGHAMQKSTFLLSLCKIWLFLFISLNCILY